MLFSAMVENISCAHFSIYAIIILNLISCLIVGRSIAISFPLCCLVTLPTMAFAAIQFAIVLFEYNQLDTREDLRVLFYLSAISGILTYPLYELSFLIFLGVFLQRTTTTPTESIARRLSRFGENR